MKPSAKNATWILVLALGLTSCSAPVRPDLPTLITIDDWNSQSGQGHLRVDYRDHEPARLERLECTLEDPHSENILGRIKQKPALPLDAYGTEQVAFHLPFPKAQAKSPQLDYRLRCQLQLNQRTEKTRTRSTLYLIPAENGLYR